MKAEEKFVLVPATFRERQDYMLNNKPRTWEQIQDAEREAKERKQAAEAQRAAEAAKLVEDEKHFSARSNRQRHSLLLCEGD